MEKYAYTEEREPRLMMISTKQEKTWFGLMSMTTTTKCKQETRSTDEVDVFCSENW